MCDKEVTHHNGLVPDEVTIYLVCKTRDCFNDSKDQIQETAFYKNSGKDPDGLSTAPTPDEARGRLRGGHGVIRITAGNIRGIDRGLDVKYDNRDPSHIFICNLPCYDGPAEERKLAEDVATELVICADIESNRKFSNR